MDRRILKRVSGNGAVSIVILGSIVVPLGGVAILCWIFWRHRHDE